MFQVESFRKAAKNAGLHITEVNEGNFGKIIYIDFNHDFVRYAKIHKDTKQGDIINVYCGNSEGVKYGYKFKNYSDMANTILNMTEQEVLSR